MDEFYRLLTLSAFFQFPAGRQRASLPVRIFEKWNDPVFLRADVTGQWSPRGTAQRHARLYFQVPGYYRGNHMTLKNLTLPD